MSENSPKHTLSKSRFQYGRQCKKRLWLEVHRPDLAERSADMQDNRFGELARELIGGGVGILIDAAYFEKDKALEQTRGLLAERAASKPLLFEAAFEHEGVQVRVDALLRLELADQLIEVKASTEVKPEHLWDCAIQTWVMRGAGRPVSIVRLGHINKEFVYAHEGNYDGLLNLEYITEEVEALLPKVPAIVADLAAVVSGAKPDIATGPQCKKPYPCPFTAYCRSAEPPAPAYPVEDLRQKKLVANLREAGYHDLRDVSDDLIESAKHKRIAQAARDGVAVVSTDFFATLDAIPYPRYYLDFETISFAIPRWLGTRPYQNVPFQFSCHIETADGALDHRHFLDLSGANPCAAFVDAMLDAVGDAGPILVWNQSFESGRVHELATMFPDRADALHAMGPRMVDLLLIYRAHYYHRDMHGSWSIKAVLPTIAPDLDYAALEVADGTDAQQAYMRAIAPDTLDAERAGIRRDLLTYCERDTYAMVRLARWRP